eukprot:9113300-Pyramimonas_sp.AAC.1
MDSQRSWSKRFGNSSQGVALHSCNVLVHADGGTKAQSCSATGWVVEVGRFIDGAWNFGPVAMSGSFFATPISSFQAEALALEECAVFLQKLLTGSHGGASGAGTAPTASEP